MTFDTSKPQILLYLGGISGGGGAVGLGEGLAAETKEAEVKPG